MYFSKHIPIVHPPTSTTNVRCWRQHGRFEAEETEEQYKAKAEPSNHRESRPENRQSAGIGVSWNEGTTKILSKLDKNGR